MQYQPMKRCPQCQNFLHHSAPQCPNCKYLYGTPTMATPTMAPPTMRPCVRCGAPLVSTVRFCSYCGASQVGGKIKKAPKGIDEGFCLDYFSLSYRRKFFRTLWSSPFLVILIILGVSPVLILVCTLLWIAQGAYNYAQWKTEEES